MEGARFLSEPGDSATMLDSDSSHCRNRGCNLSPLMVHSRLPGGGRTRAVDSEDCRVRAATNHVRIWRCSRLVWQILWARWIVQCTRRTIWTVWHPSWWYYCRYDFRTCPPPFYIILSAWMDMPIHLHGGQWVGHHLTPTPCMFIWSLWMGNSKARVRKVGIHTVADGTLSNALIGSLFLLDSSSSSCTSQPVMSADSQYKNIFISHAPLASSTSFGWGFFLLLLVHDLQLVIVPQ